MYIDTKKLRRALIDYYGTAAFGGFPAAFVSVSAINPPITRNISAKPSRR